MALQVPDMAYARPKVFRDPVHGLISIAPEDEFLIELIDTPEFQRLRRVRQLGVSSVTYPSAEHSRFSHSLGVMNFAQRILDELMRRYAGEQKICDLIREKAKVVKAAALLHDTGHGPFSHACERAFEAGKQHEDRSQSIITAPESAVPRILREVAWIKPEEVRSLIGKGHPYPFLTDIVSSQLDADRMDYLLRDAMATGVHYGKFDAEWVLHSLCLGKDPRAGDTTGPESCRLCLETKRGVHAAEQLIGARLHMSMQVYFHRNTRRWEAHLLCLFYEAARLAAAGELPPGTLPAVVEYFAKRGGVSHAVFLQVDEPAILGCLGLWAVQTDPTFTRLAFLARTMQHREKTMLCHEFPADIAQSMEARERLKSELQKGCGPEMGGWVADWIEFKSYKLSEPIYLSDGALEATAGKAQESSFLFRAFGGKEQPTLARLYYLPDLKDQVELIIAKNR